ncbi:hypothetical protein [Paenibacillus humicus]|uniref:hypothetical protein n=1 Tax=Paenibacillus humicus TaxID=412861 RepID=UPI003D2B4D63
MNVILPLAPPLIESYLHHLYQTAIICNNNKTAPWLLSNYIQIYYDGNELAPVQFYLPDETGYTWSPLCPWLETQILNKNTIANLNIDIIDFIKQSISDGYYFVTYINEKYIPGKISYEKKEDFSHMFLINGYNKEKQTLNHLGYNNKVLSQTEISFSNFRQAYYSNRNYPYYTHDKIYLMKINNNFNYEFNLTHVFNQLKDLIHSRRQDKFNNDPNHLFGYNVYSNLLNIMDKEVQEYQEINIIPFLLLSEHKKLMKMRIDYMIKQGFIDNGKRFQNDFEDIEKKFIILRNKALKYNFSKDINEVIDIKKEVEKYQYIEMELIHKIIL